MRVPHTDAGAGRLHASFFPLSWKHVLNRLWDRDVDRRRIGGESNHRDLPRVELGRTHLDACTLKDAPGIALDDDQVAGQADMDGQRAAGHAKVRRGVEGDATQTIAAHGGGGAIRVEDLKPDCIGCRHCAEHEHLITPDAPVTVGEVRNELAKLV
jgi:hypothetical protein